MSIPLSHAVTITICIICFALITCEAGLLRRRSGVANFFQRYARNKGVKTDFEYADGDGEGDSEDGRRGTANQCPEISPWPCKTEGHCLAFDFICDGVAQCPDKYDEDSALCTAKARPAKDTLRSFISKYKNWFIPNILGNRNIDQIASLLSESKTIDDFIKAAGLDEEQAESLRTVMNDVKMGRSVDLIMFMDLPERMWPELYYYFGRIVRSGFLGAGQE